MTTLMERTEEKTTVTGVIRSLHRRRPPVELPAWLRWSAYLVVIGALAVTPLIMAPTTNLNLSMVMVYAMVGMGLNLLTGNCGQISLGHSAFFALGAYIAAVGIQAGFHYLAVLPLAAVVCFAVGYLFGIPALRLQGLHLALITLGLALVTPALIKRLDGVTSGQEGISVVIAPKDGLPLEADQRWYYLCLIVVAVGFIAARRLSSGRIGRSLIAVRDNEMAAETTGIRASRVKTTVFGISASYAGLGGVLYVYVVQFVGPDSFGLTMAIAFITMIVVGGLGSVTGAILGAFFIQYMPMWTSGINQAAAGVTYGVVLIAAMFVMPFGIVGLFRAGLAPFLSQFAGRKTPS